MPRVKKTLADLSKLKTSIESIPTEYKDAAACIFTEILFLHNTLEDLKPQIKKDGAIIRTTRGQTETIKENPALKSYNTSIMRYSQLIKQLTDMLPEPAKTPESDPLIDFIKEGVQ